MSNVSTVFSLQSRKNLQFISDSQDITEIKKHVGKEAIPYDSFFVSTADGDYTEVWGMCGIVPYLSKLATRLK